MTEEQRQAFEKAARPLIEWLAQNMHPHSTVIVNATTAELLDGVCVFRTDDYLVD